ncbi:DUF6531 domain-containing protein [Thauera mechernichensis]|uniref:DUF6531 domain-containing protein n=1 Tax=Thauera mechernichensis TaxID=82788 RepID=A0ABW3WFI8_9RHOO|nr:DUF6531 domain-containing protein [Thauera mechernichensis]MDG3064637.1 RHS repeat-associated core domain-containing protein [Thauera mechernichensis]
MNRALKPASPAHVRNAVARALLALLLAMPLISGAQLSTNGGGSSLPQSRPSDTSCTPSDGGNPGGAQACAEAAPASQDEPDGVGRAAGNPIDVITGNKYQNETDLPALPGPLGLEIVRHYNSAQAGTDSQLGLLGRGWRLSYETDLHANGDQLLIIQADGKHLSFTATDAGGRRYSHADPARGTVIALRSPQSPNRQGHRWTWPDGRELDFDARGKLVQIRLPSGEFLSLTRGLDGELMKVTDPQGRSLNFEYAPRRSRGFRGVVAITSPLGRFTYSHQNERTLPGLSNLVAATLPDGTTRRYHYGADIGESAPGWPHHLTGITVVGKRPDGTAADAQRLSTYAYDAAGRAVMSVRGTPRQLDASGQLLRGSGIEQVDLRFSAPDRTELTNSLGETTRYRHTRINGEPRLLEAIGPGCARCGETNVRYAYDRYGALTEITRLDPGARPLASTRIERDALGRVLRESHIAYAGGKPLPARLLARYAYTGATPRPVLIARPSVIPGKEHQIRFTYNDHGQRIEVTESGFSPLDAAGEPAASAEAATPISRTTTYAYTAVNGRSLLAQIDGPLPNGPNGDPGDSDVTRLDWDTHGSFVIRLTQPGGLQSALQHHPQTGLLRRVVNDDGFETTFTYNARQQITSVRSRGPGWSIPLEQRIHYDELGNPTEEAHLGQAAASWRRQWDTQGRLLWHASALGVLSSYTYDTESRLTEHTLQSASLTQSRHRRYDDRGRLAHAWDNAGRSLKWRYDEHGQLERVIDALGFEHAVPARISPLPHELAQATQVQALRDDFGRLVWRRSPDTGTVLRELDAADRIAAMRDARGNLARYEYDAQGRILRQVITDAASSKAETTHWRYAGRRLIELVHPTQSERYEYDARGLRSARIVRLATEQGELTSVTRYEHDEVGRLVATTLPDGSRLRYERNGQGQVVALMLGSVQTPWLRQLEREQLIASDFERDLAGLRAHTAGNGIQTLYQRSREGVLARVVHRHRTPERVRLARYPSDPVQLGLSRQEVIERLLGIAPARAQSPNGTQSHAPMAANSSAKANPDAALLPGALGLPEDPSALLDHRYVWDARGNLLHSRQQATHAGAQPTWHSHAYDRHNQLLVSVEWHAQDKALAEQAVWRYAYDPTQRRVLSQQDVGSQAELRAGTRRSAFEPGSHRRIDADRPPARYSASGQPEQLGSREYDWDARGRLVEVREHGKTLARYGYDHRGLRNVKHANGQTRYTLYDEARQPLAEFDAHGRILRQYVWLADLPVAVIDRPQGAAPTPAAQGTAARIIGDLIRLVQSWLAGSKGIVWLHGNHLGAPELVTDTQGQVLWRAHYAPFGAANVHSGGFTLNLRLPGQYLDAETGLHFNRARYYDPEQGQYLSPDPLGTPDGPNPYAYVAYNPLRFIDPDGLILFAFDGTGNSDDRNDPAMGGDGFTNVVHFLNAYDSGNHRYVSGVGTVHRDDEYGHIRPEDYATHTLLWWLTPGDPVYVNDMGGNYSGPARIDRMMLYIRDEAAAFDKNKVMDIDIVGFSRGAAQARDFANRIVAGSVVLNGKTYYKYTTEAGKPGCQWVNLRFMGLFDTVLSTNFSGTGYNLGIPSEFAYVAQAVALNEHRSGAIGEYSLRNPKPHSMHWGGFPLQSIGASSTAPGQIRIERGFIGAHADIGGGYPDNEQGLSLVALNWMVQQAKNAGVTMKAVDPIPMNDVVLHDQSNVIRVGDPRILAPKEVRHGDMSWTDYVFAEDREVRGATSGTSQRTMGFDNGGMVHADTLSYITWLPREVEQLGKGTALDPRKLGNVTGTVDMQGYLEWLRDPSNGYGL